MLGGVLGAGVLLAVGRLEAAADPADPRTIAARQRFFGADTVDPATGAVRRDRVVLSWVGCTTYALAMGGSVLLLDAWVPRLTSPGYVPATPQDLVDLAPEAILVGHGHFDHAGDAGQIAQATGAAIYGTAEHGVSISAQLAEPTFRTVALGDANSVPGERHDFTVGAVSITAIRHLHSAPTAPERPGGSAPFFPLPDLCPMFQHPPSLSGVLENQPRRSDEEGGSLLYQLRIPGFSLVWHDSVGPLTEQAPELYDQFAALPPTTLHIGAIQGFNQLTNGLRDPRRYIEAFAPRLFVPAHHDNWLPGFTASAATYEATLRAELDRIPAAKRPELRALRDPADYVSPQHLTFTV